MAIIELRLPLPPSLNHIWERTRGGGMRYSDRYKAWIEQAGWLVLSQHPKPITGPYSLCVEVARPDKRRRDLDNVAFKAIGDLLVKLRIVEDDSLCEQVTARWSNTGDGVLVHIEPFIFQSKAEPPDNQIAP